MNRIALWLACLMMVGGVLGCGGGGSNVAPQEKSRALMTIFWPSRDRLIPIEANSIKVVVTDGSSYIRTHIEPRPTTGTLSVILLNELPVGQLTVSAAAYPTTTATGVAMAFGQTQVEAVAGQQFEISITMQSTIDHLEINPSSDSLYLYNSISPTVSAKDASGSLVLIGPSTCTWQSSDISVATAVNGVVTAVGSGTATITVTETESGKSAFMNLTIPTVAVSVAPTSAIVPLSQQQSFSSTVTGHSNTAVIWSVVESGGGSITSAGVYTAPTTAGTYHVKATSAIDGTKYAQATITVPIEISVDPVNVALSVGHSTTFTATTLGTDNTAVTWEVVEAEGGTVTAEGVYTAPSLAGTYHVTATSVADPTKTATATVMVDSSSGKININ